MAISKHKYHKASCKPQQLSVGSKVQKWLEGTKSLSEYHIMTRKKQPAAEGPPRRSPRRSPRNHAPRNPPPPPVSSVDPGTASNPVTTVTTKSLAQRSDYADILRENGIEFDSLRLHIPDSVLQLAIKTAKLPTEPTYWRRTSMMERLNTLINSEEATLRTTINSTDLFPSLEDFPYQFNSNIILPLTKASNLPLAQAMIPKRSSSSSDIQTPSPDEFFGYSSEAYAAEDIQLQIKCLKHLTKLSMAEVYLPFLVVEYKSQSRRGTTWHAANQNAVAVSSIINSMIQLQQLSEDFNIYEAVNGSSIFSLALDGISASLSIHWYEPERKIYPQGDPANDNETTNTIPKATQPRFLSSEVAHFRFNKVDEVHGLRAAMEGIFHWASTERLFYVRTFLADYASTLTSSSVVQWIVCSVDRNGCQSIQ